MKIIHTSPELITNIHSNGIAGDCLFFSNDEYCMSAAATFVYELEIDEDAIVRARDLYDEAIIARIAELFECDEETAERLLDGRENEWGMGNCDADLSWMLQGLRGKCATVMGYQACEDEDEQGTVYIVPMTGRESELVLIKQ